MSPIFRYFIVLLAVSSAFGRVVKRQAGFNEAASGLFAALGGGARSLAASQQGASGPLAASQQGGSGPLAALQQGGSGPLAALQQGGSGPLAALQQGGSEPFEALQEGSSIPMDFLEKMGLGSLAGLEPPTEYEEGEDPSLIVYEEHDPEHHYKKGSIHDIIERLEDTFEIASEVVYDLWDDIGHANKNDKNHAKAMLKTVDEITHDITRAISTIVDIVTGKDD